MGQEANVTRTIYKLTLDLLSQRRISLLKMVKMGRAVTTKSFRDAVVHWFGQETPWPLVEPDLVLVFEDLKQVVDNVLLTAVEMKVFAGTSDLDKRMRQAFREIGQPLRNLVVGFDSTVLWHIFDPSIQEQKVLSYTNMVADVTGRLELPMVYLATAMADMSFRVYKPSYASLEYEAESLISWLRNLSEDRRASAPDQELKARRSALKLALGIPT